MRWSNAGGAVREAGGRARGLPWSLQTSASAHPCAQKHVWATARCQERRRQAARRGCVSKAGDVSRVSLQWACAANSAAACS